MNFKVDTLLSGFKFFHTQLLKTAEAHDSAVAAHDQLIADTLAARQVATSEAQRARNAAEKIAAFFS